MMFIYSNYNCWEIDEMGGDRGEFERVYYILYYNGWIN